MREIGAIAPNARRDRVAAFGMRADRAREREQFDCPVEIHLTNVLGDRRALCFLALANLNIGTKTACLLFDGEAAHRISTERFILTAGRGCVTPLTELAGELAFGIVGASDKSAELAAAQCQPPIAAFRA